MERLVIESSNVSNSVIEADDPSVLSQIYKPEVNIVIWRRKLSPALILEVQNLLFNGGFSVAQANLRTGDFRSYLEEIMSDQSNTSLLKDDIVQLIEMFCYLFDLEGVGIRIKSLAEPMCPRFHVDRVPCRLVSTYYGLSTEWLENECIDRSKLGHGNQGLSDDKSGLISSDNCIQTLESGDVALLKGELWPDNEGQGLVHRSPNASDKDKRLLLSLDFMS